MREQLLALAGELEEYEGDTCEGCAAYEQPECRGYLPCTEIVAKYCARKVREIAENDAEDVTTVSAYDLLPDDDREALAWVREMGGVDAAKARTMPEGCEWPRFEDGEQVRIGDEFAERIYGNPCRVGHFAINKHALLIFDEEDLNDCEAIDHGSRMRVKRPEHTVLAADGEPLEVGQTVYTLNDDRPYTVKKVETNRVSVNAGEGAYDVWKAPTYLTHQRLVLDADGVLIKEGDTVYVAPFDDPLTVRGFAADGRVLMDYHSDDSFGYRPEDITHTKPEPPDSWERIDEDAGKNPFDYCNDVGHRLDTCVNAERVKSRDLVRRCRALAERGE